MDKYSYRFTVLCLGISIVLLVIASIALVFQEQNVMQLVPVIIPLLTGLTGLLVSPPPK